MAQARIRPLALGVFWNQDRVLVFEGYDPVKDAHFFRPLGGGIEFGERGQEALVREMREELGVEISDLRFFGTLENVFVFNGQPGHEIVLLYEAELVDRRLYDVGEIQGIEDDTAFVAVWKHLTEFDEGTPPLYPDGLLPLLQQRAQERSCGSTPP